MMKKLSIVLLISLIGFSATAQNKPLIGGGRTINPYLYQIFKSETYEHASVVSAHALASQVGAEVMKRGGNAFDAAIATQLALAVVYPVAGNIGGGGFLLGRKSDGKTVAIDFRETAPTKASRNMYLDKDGKAQTALSQNGHLASGVPGTVAGLFATLPYAKLPFKELIQPAIDLAEFGFVLTENEARSFNWTIGNFKKYSTRASAFTSRTEWRTGDTLIQKDLANTLKRIRDKGAKGFYSGRTAQLLVAEMKRGGGIVGRKDLGAYRAKSREVLEFSYRGHQIIGFPPPSSGGIILGQVLKMLEAYPLDQYGFQSPEAVQLIVEAERRAYADRAEHLGDPDFWKVPVSQLLSSTYLKQRMDDFEWGKASVSASIKAGEFRESDQTTHLSIVDPEGNMVAVTTTLNGAYGSKTVVGGAGFLLNNEMDDFSIKPGVANMYGAIGGDANAIEANKRMLSSMCPTLVLKNGKPYMVVGTPGGTTIPTSVLQALVNSIDFKLDAASAINYPKFHHQWLPDVVDIENGFPEETRKKLEAMGYTFRLRDGIGRTEIIVIGPDGKLHAAADKRGEDSVAGF
jgi:gamma-glutamyltranspeptidase/glutathione hydrolase